MIRRWLASKFRTIVSGIVILRMPSSRIGPGDSPKGLCESQLDPVTFSFLEWRSVMNLLKVWLVFPAFSLHRFVFNLFLLFACFCLFVLLSENFLQTCGFNHYLTKKQKTSPNLACLRISKLNCKKKIWDKHLDKLRIVFTIIGPLFRVISCIWCKTGSKTPSTLVNARWLP